MRLGHKGLHDGVPDEMNERISADPPGLYEGAWPKKASPIPQPVR
ncbi:hypothetical protein BN940_17671 [Castellaniella defragrans 65Phen]|uniref:Uncharacterized protein n=1 Tax=Castellaniella defragrans (strain DSM 12143 / CCUG 39792 / 65Phen) TaxID=1437824 RepID=W8XA51_CASD6|nr:hypothetical protein BN940_17671 [Castellaniella defragrans 65Phen]